jgi:hypothetical protein
MSTSELKLYSSAAWKFSPLPPLSPPAASDRLLESPS